MWKPLTLIYNAIRKNLRLPVSAPQFILESPAPRIQLGEPKRVIASSGVVQWHEWSWPHHEHGNLSSWQYSHRSYGNFDIHHPKLERLGRCEIIDNWECDIQDVTGLGASKSNLNNFHSLDDMVETNSREMITPLTECKLHQNLGHKEIRIMHQHPSSDFFARYLWDGRVFLINSGGSHHFAAARYIAARIGVSVPLRGKLRTYFIDPQAVTTLRRDFDIYAMHNDNDVAINNFRDAMRSFNVTYLWRYLPRPYGYARAIFLPKIEPRAVIVSTVLRDAGLLDLGEYLSTLCEKQAL